MEALPSELKVLVRKIAKEEGIQNFSLVTNQNVTTEGDGYIGKIEGVSIRDKDTDTKIDLVLKRAPESEILRQQFPIRDLFLREIVMYEEVFPEIKKFQKEYNIPKPFDSFTEAYGSVTEELKESIFIKNLKEDGFKSWNRLEPMDSQHLTLVLTTYARFHAVSLAMKRLDPKRFITLTTKAKKHVMIEFESFRKQIESEKQKMEKNQNIIMFDIPFKALEDNPRLIEAIKNSKNIEFERLYEVVNKLYDHENSVLLHADCWSANMLFKYENKSNPEKPTEVKLIDWQISYVGTPVFDISYFFYINAGKSDLWDYKNYLKIYHDALCENIKAFGLEPGSIFPFESLEKDWKEYSALGGFNMSIIMLYQCLSDGKTHDFEEMADQGLDIYDTDNRVHVITDRYKRRMTDLAEFVVDNNFL